MDPSNTEKPEAPPTVVFGRSNKKRKAYRQRGGDSAQADEPVATAHSPEKTDTNEETATPTQPRPAGGDDDEETKPETDDGAKGDQDDDGSAVEEKDDNDAGDGNGDDDAAGLTVAELIRRRKTRKPKIGGVEFRDEAAEASSSSALSRYADMAVDGMDLDIASDPMAMGMQFVPQTGMIGELVNKHMEEYVDAQLAKRHRAEAEQAHLPATGGLAGSGPSSGPSAGAGTSGAASSVDARQQLATKGKLHEIDLGAEARARNVAMTERATQRLRSTGDAGGGGSAEEGTQSGRGGKRRRGSDDIKRDQLVEQFLHENRMDVDVYDASRDAAGTSAATTEGRPTDDRVAEQFRREFMEAVAQRMRRKRKPLGPPAKPKTARNDEEILRGPKLGGSRNVRSVIRDKLLQKQEEERHNMPKYEQQLLEQKRRMNRRR
ncbi:hypothetical protein SPBR_07209 [Sporothrix brasiliensis 5110]|uniref:mRNA splicing factor RNA helicase n=1 Tax=Sporothrix brasiliensis 5110 TaxID=1398154 RepID=A0A0C2IKP3_9PEZI|nr:uncharacterized protein SPBR_07209 [Sporothrix brasiliensis 5110]KIH89646.1 hypothetical protein SPBR_07209 [Sporothrix brasiliensis 5110]